MIEMSKTLTRDQAVANLRDTAAALKLAGEIGAYEVITEVVYWLREPAVVAALTREEPQREPCTHGRNLNEQCPVCPPGTLGSGALTATAPCQHRELLRECAGAVRVRGGEAFLLDRIATALAQPCAAQGEEWELEYEGPLIDYNSPLSILGRDVRRVYRRRAGGGA